MKNCISGGGPEAGAAGGTALALSKLTTSPQMLERLFNGTVNAPA